MSALPSRVDKPRICFVGLDNLPVLAREYSHHYVGGEPVQQTLLARALTRQGYDVSMVIADFGQPDGAIWDGIRTYKAYRVNAGLPIARFIHPRWTGLWAALRRADADVYYTSCAGAQVGELAMFCHRYGRKLIFRSASDTDCDPARLLIKYWRDKKLYAYGLRRADAVLTQSHKQQQMMRANFGIDSVLAGMLVDGGANRPLAARDIDMLWVSNLRQLKRPDLFLDLSARMPQLSAHIVGGSFGGEMGLFTHTQKRAADMLQVRFHGRLPYQDIGPLYERARIFVNTSDIEGFPNTYLQAWSRGTPVVAFFDPDGLIAREQLGFAVRNMEEMEAGVRALMNDELTWRAMSARCLAFSQRHFCERKILQVYVSVIDRSASSARAAPRWQRKAPAPVHLVPGSTHRPGVLVMVPTLTVGGAEKHAISLINHLDTRRFRLALAYVKGGDTLVSQLDPSRGVDVLALHVKSKFDWGAVTRLARYIDVHGIDIVVCTNGYPLLYALAASWRTKRRVSLLEVFHTTTQSSLKFQLRMVLNRFTFRQCEVLIYVSQRQKEYWQARALRGKRDVVIRNGIDTDHFTDHYTPAQKTAVRAEFGFGANDYLIGLCAGLRPEKAHGDLVRAIKQLRSSSLSVRAMLIGEGSERSVIEQQIAGLDMQQHVVITGYKTDVRPYIAACDVMVLTSHEVETFSIAALEAMSLAKPVILTRIGGADEQVTEGINGYLYEPGDIQELAAHLQHLSDPERRQSMGAAAARTVREKFTLKQMISAFTVELLDLAPAPAPAPLPRSTDPGTT